MTEEKTETIVCEIKSSSAWNSAFKQLYFRNGDTHKPGYLKSYCFDKAYACFGVVVKANQKTPLAEHEAGSLIFTKGTRPIIFKEDPISGTPSSKRGADSVLVDEKCQSDLIKYADKDIARLMISSIPIEKVIPNVGKLTTNELIEEIGSLNVETVLKSM